MSFNNCCMISSSCDFQAHPQRSQRRFSQTALVCFDVLRDLSPVLRGLSQALADLSHMRKHLWPALQDMSPVLQVLSPALRNLVQALQDCSQALRDFSCPSELFRWRSQVRPGAPKGLSCVSRCSQNYHNHSHVTPVPVIRNLSYSEGWPRCPPRV
jgi:hypothetical protein